MDAVLASLVVISFFLLRLAVPIAVILLVGFLLSRLDAKWQLANSR